MVGSGYSILWAVITGVIVICLAIAFKHDKRKVVAVLIIGTLLAGIIGFRLPIYPRKDAPSSPSSSLPNGSFLNLEPTESISQMQIAEKLNTINTYKAHGTRKSINGEGKTFIYQREVEYIRPNKLHTILIYEGKEIEETITVGDHYCMRHGQQDEWFCGSHGPISDGIQRWIEIVMGEASSDDVTSIEHGIRLETWHNEKCRLYYKTESGFWINGKETFALCIDPDTLLPVEYFYRGEWPDAPSMGTQATIEEFDVFDINKPIDISLPAQ